MQVTAVLRVKPTFSQLIYTNYPFYVFTTVCRVKPACSKLIYTVYPCNAGITVLRAKHAYCQLIYTLHPFHGHFFDIPSHLHEITQQFVKSAIKSMQNLIGTSEMHTLIHTIYKNVR